jgi:hypothetical protein
MGLIDWIDELIDEPGMSDEEFATLTSTYPTADQRSANSDICVYAVQQTMQAADQEQHAQHPDESHQACRAEAQRLRHHQHGYGLRGNQKGQRSVQGFPAG